MDLTKINDLALLEAIRSDDRAAFQELFRRYWEPLYTFAFRKLKSGTDAEDIVQEFFIRLWSRRDGLQVATSVAAYFHSAVHYEVLSRISRSLKEKEQSEEFTRNILDGFIQGHTELELKELVGIVEAAISQLPPKMQEVYRMRQEKNLTLREIGRVLNISEHTARNQLTSAYRKLGVELNDALLITLLLAISSYMDSL